MAGGSGLAAIGGSEIGGIALTINVLGTEYEIVRPTSEQDKKLKEIDGYCDNTICRIAVSGEESDDTMNKENLEAVRQKQLRHEIIHAFLYESGLAENSDWALNEEMVDWVAFQIPKLGKAMRKAGALDAEPS